MPDLLTWIPFYEELANVLLSWQSRQTELIALLKRLRADGHKVAPIEDQKADGSRFLLREIDPFTVFATFNRGLSGDNRRRLASPLGQELGIGASPPKDFAGIPTVDNRHTWFFAYAKDRTAEDIPSLWAVFERALRPDPLGDPEFPDAFDRALHVYGVSFNLTMGLFWVRPRTFLSLDGVLQHYAGLTIKASQLNARKYIETILEVGRRGTPFPELSHDAWLKARQTADKRPIDPEDLRAPTESLPIPCAWLLSWNPNRWIWKTLGEDRLAVAGGQMVRNRWSCGNRRAAIGDRVFLVRTGEEPRGIIARGRAASAPYEHEHYDADRAAAGERRQVIDVEFDDIRDPARDPFLKMEDLQKLSADQVWNPQQSGIEVRPEVVSALEEAWSRLPNHAGRQSVPYEVENIVADGCFLPRLQIETILKRLRSKKNLVLQGPPGTGKSWLARRLAHALIGTKDDRRSVSVQFHPNLSYEDFVRGWRPTGNGRLDLIDGVFLYAVAEARNEPELPFVVVIEEINRGNPAQIFGELLTLMEDSKRSPDEAMRLAYPRGAKLVYVPENLFIIGTMNVADRSLALVDLALRRRFAFVDLEPEFNERWGQWLNRFGFNAEVVSHIRERIVALNQQITKDKKLGPQFQIGHSYVTPHLGQTVEDPRDWFRQVVETEISPLLHEYWYDDAEAARKACEQLLVEV
jgi:5-methylcytosine-specific restriction enzyme B